MDSVYKGVFTEWISYEENVFTTKGKIVYG